MPLEAVIAVVEVKTTVTKSIFHKTLDNFKEQKKEFYVPHYLFIFNAPELIALEGYFDAYKKNHGEYTYDHDTYQLLPDEITGIDNSYHLKKDYVDTGVDTFGYSAYSLVGVTGEDISALENFYLSIYERVERYLTENKFFKLPVSRKDYFKHSLSSYFAFGLFII